MTRFHSDRFLCFSIATLYALFATPAHAIPIGSVPPPPPHVILGSNAGDLFGWSISNAADVNGDGFADFAIATGPGANQGGSVTIYSGQNGSVLQTTAGSLTNVSFGHRVALADLNADGTPDLVATDPYAAPGGEVRIYSGRGGTALSTFQGSTGDYFGWSIASADFNGDGRADLAVGATQVDNPTAPGYVTVLGRTPRSRSVTELGRFTGERAVDAFGYSLSVYERNGDQRSELLISAIGYDVGAAQSAGRTSSYSLGSSTPAFSLDGSTYNETFGANVATIADINNDGVSDIAISSFGTLSVRVVSGSNGQTLWQSTADSTHELFGYAIASGADLDEDGVRDVFIGDPCTSTTVQYSCEGSVTAVSGATGVTLFELNGEAAGDFFGSAVVDLGDADHDGRRDLAISAPGQSGVGAVHLYNYGQASTGKGGSKGGKKGA